MFDVLMYLFETYVHSEVELLMDHDELTQELRRAGFHHDEINKALDWLEQLAELQDGDKQTMFAASHARSLRVYTEQEQAKLDVSCRGFLLFLEQMQVLNSVTRELVIDRILQLDTHELDLDDMKWVILMVLFNIPGNEQAYQQMEELIFDETDPQLH